MIITTNEQLTAVRVAPLRNGNYVLLEMQRTRYNPVSYSIQPLMHDGKTIAPSGQTISAIDAQNYATLWDDKTDYRIG